MMLVLINLHLWKVLVTVLVIGSAQKKKIFKASSYEEAENMAIKYAKSNGYTDLIDSEDSSSTKDSTIDFVDTDDLRLIALEIQSEYTTNYSAQFRKDFTVLQFAKHVLGKEYTDLSDSEKAEVLEILGGPKINKVTVESKPRKEILVDSEDEQKYMLTKKKDGEIISETEILGKSDVKHWRKTAKYWYNKGYVVHLDISANKMKKIYKL